MLIKKFVNSTHPVVFILPSILPIHFWAEREEGIPSSHQFFCYKKGHWIVRKKSIEEMCLDCHLTKSSMNSVPLFYLFLSWQAYHRHWGCFKRPLNSSQIKGEDNLSKVLGILTFFRHLKGHVKLPLFGIITARKQASIKHAITGLPFITFE